MRTKWYTPETIHLRRNGVKIACPTFQTKKEFGIMLPAALWDGTQAYTDRVVLGANIKQARRNVDFFLKETEDLYDLDMLAIAGICIGIEYAWHKVRAAGTLQKIRLALEVFKTERGKRMLQGTFLDQIAIGLGLYSVRRRVISRTDLLRIWELHHMRLTWTHHRWDKLYPSITVGQTIERSTEAELADMEDRLGFMLTKTDTQYLMIFYQYDPPKEVDVEAVLETIHRKRKKLKPKPPPVRRAAIKWKESRRKKAEDVIQPQPATEQAQTAREMIVETKELLDSSKKALKEVLTVKEVSKIKAFNQLPPIKTSVGAADGRSIEFIQQDAGNVGEAPSGSEDGTFLLIKHLPEQGGVEITECGSVSEAKQLAELESPVTAWQSFKGGKGLKSRRQQDKPMFQIVQKEVKK